MLGKGEFRLRSEGTTEGNTGLHLSHKSCHKPSTRRAIPRVRCPGIVDQQNFSTLYIVLLYI